MIINNAGIVNGKYFINLTEEEILKTIQVNLLGPMYITKTFLPSMIKSNHGHIVSTISFKLGPEYFSFISFLHLPFAIEPIRS